MLYTKLHGLVYILMQLDVSFCTACPIDGQIRKECASHPLCHRVCNDDSSRPCPLVCVVNGCECPTGTVIDIDKNKCVTPSECSGKNYF